LVYRLGLVFGACEFMGQRKSLKAKHIEACIAAAKTEAHEAMINRDASASESLSVAAQGDRKVRELLHPVRREKK